jgi:hypothetical protein
LAVASAGSSIAAKIAMMAITTRTSINVNARLEFTIFLDAAEENRFNLVLGQHRDGAIQEHEAQHA